MIVSELIALLREMPQDAKVFTIDRRWDASSGPEDAELKVRLCDDGRVLFDAGL